MIFRMSLEKTIHFATAGQRQNRDRLRILQNLKAFAPKIQKFKIRIHF